MSNSSSLLTILEKTSKQTKPPLEEANDSIELQFDDMFVASKKTTKSWVDREPN